MNPHKLKILVVDDDRITRVLLSTIIKNEGHAVSFEARDSEEAILKFPQMSPDIVFLDVEMPGQDGFFTLEAMRQFGTNAQIVMMSATPTRSRVQKAIDLQATGFLVKPFNPRKVCEFIEFAQKHLDSDMGSIEFFF